MFSIIEGKSSASWQVFQELNFEIREIEQVRFGETAIGEFSAGPKPRGNI